MLIPEGTRHIRAAHQSYNHLALMVRDGSYMPKGNWVVSHPRTYQVASIHVYTCTTEPKETLHAAGPTSQDLLLQEQTQALGWSLQ